MLDGHDLDVVRFERLLEEGARRLEEGEPAEARVALEEALALWRGPALPDLPGEDDIRRLEEQRLLALERRIDADLALGRHDRVIGELRELLARHPLREHLRGQLMLALYRSGRQAEALDAYRDGRSRLVDELGLEPAPELQALEHQILTQDTAIDTPSAPRGVASGGGGRRRLVAAAAMVAVVAAAAVVLLSRDGDDSDVRKVLEGDSVAAIDARTGAVVDGAATGTGPAALATGPGAVWSLNADDRTVTRIDTSTGDRRTFGVGATPTDIAFGLGELWVGTAERVEGAQFAGRTATAVARLDPETGIAADPIALPPARGVVSNVAANHLAFASGSAWMINPDFTLSRIDPRRHEVTAVLTHVSAIAVAGDGRRLWVLNRDRTVARVDPRTNRVVQRIRVPASDLNAIALGAGAVWALDPAAGRLWRVEPSGQASIDVGAGADAVASGAGAVWVSNSLLGQVLRIDPATDRVVRRIALGGTPRDLAVAGDRVWVAVVGGGASAARPARLGDVQPVASRTCGAPLAGAAAPRLLIASDLPLQGGARFPSQQMAAAVVSVLRARGFRAGRFPLGYQSCDDSVARSGLFDPAKCAANMKAYVAAEQLVGVVGPMNSGCAFAQVPIASRASLALVSPTASDVALTRPPPGAPRRAVRRLYPTNVRTFARLVAPDDAQGAAQAVLVQRLGARRPYVLHDGDYGTVIAEAAARALRRLGARPAGIARWDWQHRRYRAVVRRVRAARADGLVLCGLLDNDAGAVLRAVRPQLPAGAPVVGCDGLLPSSLAFERTGAAARGVYVTRSGLSIGSLPPSGRALARRLGENTDVTALYAAAATEALLDAIAASDGTRASVSAHLMRVERRDSPIGPYAIDPSGDPGPAPVSVVRLERPGGSDAILSEDGARSLDPISPPRRLWTAGG